MIPGIAKISALFDKDPEQLFMESSFDFTCFRGKISKSDVIVLTNQTEDDPHGSAMSRIEALVSILNTASSNQVPVIWLITGYPLGSTQELAYPPQYPDFFLGSKGSGAYLGAIYRHRIAAPQIAVVDQEVTSSRALVVTGADLVLMHKDSAVTIGRPSAVHSISNVKTDLLEMGGTDVHKTTTGLCAREWTEFEEVSQFLNNLFEGDRVRSVSDFIAPKVPDRADAPFDISTMSSALIDDGSRGQILWPDFAQEVLCEMGHVNGRKCGIISNNCLVKGGFVTNEAIKKMMRFISFTERLKIPTITLVDCAGLYSDKESESKGIFESAGQLLSLRAQSIQPQINVVVRRAYSAGLYIMGGGNFSSAKQLALPTAKFSIYGPKILNKEISNGSPFEANFREMLKLHDSPESMENLGKYKVVDPLELKRHLVFDD